MVVHTKIFSGREVEKEQTRKHSSRMRTARLLAGGRGAVRGVLSIKGSEIITPTVNRMTD